MKTSVSAGISVVSDDWDMVSVDQVATIENGCPFKSSYFNETEGLPLIRIRDVHTGTSETFYSGPYEERYVVHDGDLLVGMDGEFRCRKWRSGLGLLNQRVCRIVPDESRIDRDFLAMAIGAPLKQIEDFTPYTTVKHISASQIRSIKLPFPSLLEQRKIATVLGLVQQATEQQEQLLALTAELRRALLQQLLTHGLHREPQKQTERGPIPKSWELVELASAVEQIDYGISAPIPKTPPANGVKIVSTADLTKDGRLLYDKIRRITAPEKAVKRLTLQTGDVLFNWRNSAELIGKSAVFQEQDEPHVFASFILRIKCGEKKSHNFFIAHLMNHFRETQVFIKLARRAVNQANYNRNEISVLKIPLPSYKEQREIAGAIACVDGKIQSHRRKHAALRALFRTLLHELMTARIRVHEFDLSAIESCTND
jgi:type I restriction enzyme S subunit